MKQARKPQAAPETPKCVDCGGPAEVYRDLGRGIYACRSCETAHRIAAVKRNPTPENINIVLFGR